MPATPDARSARSQPAPGVHRLRLAHSNAYVLAGDGFGDGRFALVDAGTPWDARRLLRLLDAFGGLRCCSALMLTHAHPDHAGCAALVAQQSGAALCAHEQERPFLESGQIYGHGAVQRAIFGLGSLAWPVRAVRLSGALRDGESIETPAGSWRAIHTPGHTLGHTSLFRERDGVLISGDALLNVMPWTRRPGLTLAQPMFGQDMDLAMESARRLARLRPRILLAGHGEPLHDAAEPLWKFAFG